MVVGELNHPLAEIRLHDLHAERLQVGIELDLLARHRLDLGHDRTALPAGRVPADLTDDLPRRGCVFGEVGLAAYRLEPLGETLDQLRQSLEVGAAALLQVGAAGGEIEAPECRVATAAEAGHRVDECALELRVVECSVDAPGEMAPRLRHACGVLPGSPR